MIKNTFIEYINNYDKNNINKKYNDFFNSLDNNLNNVTNFIFYGPPGSGKYSSALKLIEKYSNSNLKYEKKMIILSNKNEHVIKISDIHYEINMENLTCNAKSLFNDIYINIIDSIQVHEKREGIILCKNVHLIDSELFDIFYSYMQKKLIENFTVKFILLTDHLSFINKNILNISKIIYFNKLSISNYNKLSNITNKKNILLKNNFEEKLQSINNIEILKTLELDTNNLNIIHINKTLCDAIVNDILNYKNLNYFNLRNKLYDLLTYNLNINDCIYYIIDNLITKKKLHHNFIDNIFLKTCFFFRYYDNNYRPIYHLENYVLYLISIIKKYENS